MSIRATRLFNELTKDYNIVEDSYVIPRGASYFDIDQYGEDILFNSKAICGFISNLILTRETSEEIQNWQQFRELTKENFAKNEASYMTSEARIVLKEIIEFYDSKFSSATN